MDAELEERLATAAQIMHRLTEQNMMLSTRILALENVLAFTIAHQFCGKGVDVDGLADFSAEVSGTAVGIADLIHSWRDPDMPPPLEVPRSMERILSRAENLCHEMVNRGHQVGISVPVHAAAAG